MIPVNTPLLDGNEEKYLIECIRTGWISSEGPFIKKFEDDFSAYVHRNHGIAVSNGSAALDIAVQALNLNQGDEVIMPSFTIISPAQSVVKAGLRPVLIDSDPVTWNMDVAAIESKITKKTKAIIVVHIYGLPVDMDPVLELCRKFKLFLIEDAAEMHGQTYKGKACGSFGTISIFSFYPNKHITTGEGGMIVCDDDKLAAQCRKLRNLAFEPDGRRFVHHELGWNYRMTNMQAALGLAQLEKIDEHILKKRHIGNRYQTGLASLKNFQLPMAGTRYAENIYWVYALVAESEELCLETVRKLSESKIGTRPFFWCMHEQPVFKKMGLFLDEKYPVAEKLARNGFYLPSGLGLTDAQIDTVIETMYRINS
ncbi:MAG: DegT/DnrJ/EryC1/StrS family aminotransferase [Bacteroidetes bacterium]|nr:MAG: DegT/DnrJ/EryC1/StrS family aminotransferase [Bacteroidota bacterium]